MLPDALFLTVHMYGIMIGVGVFCAFAVISLYGKKMPYGSKFSDFIYYCGILSIAVGFGSAALFQAVYDYIEDPSQGFSFGGGITFIGGLIGGSLFFLAAYALLRKKLDGKLSQALSMIPCAITVGHAFGRVGCFFAGCCYGKVTYGPLGVKFPNLPEPVHATQLYEAAFLFILFGIMSYLLLKKGFRHNMSVYLIAYGIFRFALEFLRDDHRGKLVGGISPSQFWSLLMVVIGAVLVFVMKRVYAKEDTPRKADGEQAANSEAPTSEDTSLS